MADLKQLTNRTRVVLLVLASDHVTGATGKTLTITLSKNGGSFASVSPTVTELSDGCYAVSFTTAHTDTLGDFWWKVTAAACDPVDVEDQVVVDLSGATVASVVGNVGGNVVGSTGSVAGAVASVTGNLGGSVQGNVNGTVVLSAAGIAAIHNWLGGSESYAADGALPTPYQLALMLWGAMGNVSRNPTTGVITVYKLDGVTPAMTFVPDNATNPNAYTRAS